MDKKLKAVIFLVAALGVVSLVTNYTTVEKRKQAAYDAQWVAEYGVQVPEGKTGEECFESPEECL